MPSIIPSEQNNKLRGSKTWLLPWNNLTTGLLSFLLVLFAISSWLVFIRHSSFDNIIFDFIRPHITTGRTLLMRAISFLGNTFFLLPAFLFLLFYFIKTKNKWAAISVFVIASTSVILMSALKSLIRRHRPDHQLVEGITNFSFPSGHSFMSIAFYGLFIYWAALFIKNKKAKAALIIFMIIIILLIGVSRVYLRVHFATDVIAGWSIGTCWLLVSLQVVNVFYERVFMLKNK